MSLNLSSQTASLDYATFWQRLGAMLIDGIVLLPVIALHVWLTSVSKGWAIALVIPMAVVHLAYDIYGHGRFGKTVGKWTMNISVVRLTGERIGWREAWLRSAGTLVFSGLGMIGTLVALTTIADADYYSGWERRMASLNALEPVWLSWTGVASTMWVWSEVIVMLFNPQRRALHDFIAGTVVIADPVHNTAVIVGGAAREVAPDRRSVP